MPAVLFLLQLAMMTKRSEILRMDKAIAKEEQQLKEFERLIERDNLKSEEFLRENEKKSVEARALLVFTTDLLMPIKGRTVQNVAKSTLCYVT